MDYEGITGNLLAKLKKHDEWSYWHSIRVEGYALEIGKSLGIRGNALDELSIAALLHDIGKLAIPAGILDKPGKLTPGEYQIIKQHIHYSYQILKDYAFSETICEAAQDHHERSDGNGYEGKTSICLFAKIICLSDAYDAMKHSRPYQKKKTDREVYLDLQKNCGKQFDREVCHVALNTLFP